MAEWSPEHVVDTRLARRLIGEQHPELAGASIEPLGEGWDSTAWLVDGRRATHGGMEFPRDSQPVPGPRPRPS